MNRLADKVQEEWSRLAKEEIKVDASTTQYPIFAFGSELACLRLLQAFRYSGDRAKAAYSENKKSWFFRLSPAK